MFGNCRRNAKNKSFYYITVSLTCQKCLIPWKDRLSKRFCWIWVVSKNLWIWFDFFMRGWKLELVLVKPSKTKYLLIMGQTRWHFCTIYFAIVFLVAFNENPDGIITGGQIILPFIQKWQLRLLSSVASYYIKRKIKWVDEDIDSFQFGSFINRLRQKEPLCRKKKTVVNDRAGIKTLSSGQE